MVVVVLTVVVVEKEAPGWRRVTDAVAVAVVYVSTRALERRKGRHLNSADHSHWVVVSQPTGRALHVRQAIGLLGCSVLDWVES